MPPKAKVPAAPKKTAVAAKPAAKSTSTSKVPAKKAPVTKKSDPKAAPKATASKPAVKKWTKEDDAARTIQTCARGYISRKALAKLRKEKEDYEAEMSRLEQEACIAIALQQQKEAEEQAQKEMEERKRKAEEKKRIKRMLEAAFDGDIDEINAVIKEVKDLDNKNGIGHDVVGEALRARHLMNIIDCEDAHGNTPLSEGASGGHVDVVKYMYELGADPNSRGQFKRTPLYRAAFAGHQDCCEALLLQGGDPRLYADDGQTPENVASIDAVKELFGGWDITQTDLLLAKIEGVKEKRKAQEKARREAEQSELERQLEAAYKEYDAHQKTLAAIYCDLNKRINEHDTAPAMGFEKPEITIQAIKDAEDQLEIAKLDCETSKEKIRKLVQIQREQRKEAIEADGAKLPGVEITLRELPDVLLRDVGNKIKESGKWPMVIDTTGQAVTFLRYQDTNYLNAMAPKDMTPEYLRLAIIGAIRFGKPLIIDMMEVDMFQTISDMMDGLQKGLMELIMSKKIIEEENYMKLVKEEDGENYLKQNFSPLRTENFKFILITKNIFPSEQLMSQTYVIRVIMPQ